MDGHRRCLGTKPDPTATGAGCPEVPLWKRFMDVSLIAVSAPILLPVMLGIAAAIKLLSPGPVLFRQERIGFRSRRFICLKFRTMHTGANTVTHENYLTELIRSNRPMTKLDGHDPRLIPLAWMLRSTGLDELPQLFNVLMGEMSLVGPRPGTPSEFEAYTPQQRARTKMLPGLTGLWQVSGKNRTTFNEMIELDIRYLGTLSLWRDLTILMQTPVVLLEQVTWALLDRNAVVSPSGKPVPIPPGNRAALETNSARWRRRNAKVAAPLGKSHRAFAEMGESGVTPAHPLRR